MTRPFRLSAALTAAAVAGVAFTLAAPAAAAPPPGTGTGTAHSPIDEHLDRGLVAVGTDGGVFLSWRLLAHEATGASETGLTGTDFAVYRDGEHLTDVTGSTNLLDESGTASSTYRVVPTRKGEPVDDPTSPAGEAIVWADGHHDIPLNRPADGVTPAGETYTYAANDVSTADLDGDGELEFVVKWDPSNAKDVSQKGYTGEVYLDAYELDGTQLWRIDLGVNIRAGAHYTQFMVYDFDEDGTAEVMVKTAPGTTTRPYASGTAGAERAVPLLPEDLAAGFTADDDYRWSADDYRAHLVGVFADWDQRDEVVRGQWPATIAEALAIPADAGIDTDDPDQLVDWFIGTYAPGRSERNDLTTFEGFVLEGPEYLTIFDGASGADLDTVPYEPGRGDDGLSWGDYAMSRIEPGNRVDRFLAGVAYLDGERPSALFARGYYTRSTVAAWNWDGHALTREWLVDSGAVPMSNPFADDPHSLPGTTPGYERFAGQGFHSLSAADVDADGRQELVYGSATLDDDGSLLYGSTGVLPEGSTAPGREANLGHGDAMHVADLDPSRAGLEIFTVHEGGAGAPYGWALRDAATGEVLAGEYSGADTGRGMGGDVDPTRPGVETWASGFPLRAQDGTELSDTTPGTNQSVRWLGDGTTQLVNGALEVTPTVDDWTRGTVLTADGTRTNNGTKGNPSLVADVLGDWREEVLLRTADSSALRVFTTTDVTEHALYTLLADPQYRVEVARQNTTYNQPSYPSFHLGADTDWSVVPRYAEPAAPTPEPTETPTPGPTTAPPTTAPAPAPSDGPTAAPSPAETGAPSAPDQADASPAGASDDTLARTGVEVVGVALAGLAALVLGIVLVARRARRAARAD